MKTTFLTTAMLFLFCMTNSQQKIKIYHGNGGEITTKSDIEKVNIKAGEKLTLEIINANSLLYSYDFTTKNIEVKDNKEEYAEVIISFLTSFAQLSGYTEPSCTVPLQLSSLLYTSRVETKI